jgi:hypothetical protein
MRDIGLGDIQFLIWLKSRLINIYGLDNEDIIVKNLEQIIDKLNSPFELNIDDDSFDKILSQYYADFFLEKDYTVSFGFSEKEREKLRADIKNIICDVANKNIPKEPIIRG